MYVAMLSVVWWTCALSALAAAHVYERCELARALSDQGIGRDHLSTWVCIAYHESRFDTAAQNYNSGDHGLLQISQLYWCGPGKACGVSCASLRDEDISNDVKCALRIYEEHTRIQGNGFMAWVVYPLYCKQNTKKYLEGCEESFKNTTTKVTVKSHSRTTVKPTSAPTFFSIASFLRGQYENQVNSVTDEINWLEYKFDNVDDLTLPKFDGKSVVSESDISLKSKQTKPTNAIVTGKSFQNKIEKLPAYLTISSTLQEYLEDLQRKNEGENDQANWVDVTFDNIDELKLPVPGEKKKTVVTLPPIKSKTPIKVGDTNNDRSKIPDYLKIGSIVGQYYNNEFESNRPNDNQQKSWSDIAVKDIDSLVVPNKFINNVATLTPLANSKSSFEGTDTSKSNNKPKLSPNLPSFMKIASMVKNQLQQSVKKIETNLQSVKIQNGGEFEFSLNKGTVPLSTPFTSNTVAAFEDSSKGSQNLPPYLNIVRQVYNNQFQQDTAFKTVATYPEALPKKINPESIQTQRKNETHRRHRGRTSLHTSTTSEIPITERPPPPVKPSRRIESNQFRHKNTIKPSLGTQIDTNLLKTTARTSTPYAVPTVTYTSTTNMVSSSHNIPQDTLTALAPQSAKDLSQVKLFKPETWKKSEVSTQRTTEKNAISVSNYWNTPTLVPIIKSQTTYRTPSTKATQSIFDFYLKNQRVSTTSTSKSWLDAEVTSPQTNVMSTSSYPRFIWQQLTTLRPWSTSTSVTQGKESLYQSSITTPKPWYSYSSSATSSQFRVTSKQTEATTQKSKTTYDLWATRSLSNVSWSIPKADSTTVKTLTRYDPLAARNDSTLRPWAWSAVQPTEGTTSRTTTTTYLPWSKQTFSQPTSKSIVQQMETTTPKTIYDLLAAKNYSTLKPWSWSALGPTDLTTKKTTTTSYNPWSERSLSTSKAWSLSWPTSQKSETTTESSKSGQWARQNFSTLKPWSWSNTSSTSQKMENTTILPSFALDVSTSQPQSWSNTPPATQNPEMILPSRSWTWSSTRIEPQISENTKQTPSTLKPRFTWDSSNPWSWSWATTPSILQSSNLTTQNTTKSWGSRSFSTRPWSWMTTTTPKPFNTNNSFSQSSTSTTKSPLSSRTWSISPQKLNIYSSTTALSTTEITKPSTSASSTTQSLFDLYLSNFGRTPIKRKQDQQNSVPGHSSSEVSQAKASETNS